MDRQSWWPKKKEGAGESISIWQIMEQIRPTRGREVCAVSGIRSSACCVRTAGILGGRKGNPWLCGEERFNLFQ